MNTFTKADLKTGMRVKLKNGDFYIVLKDIDFEEHHDFVLLRTNRMVTDTLFDSDYDENLKNLTSHIDEYLKDILKEDLTLYDIVEIYNCPACRNYYLISYEVGNLIWSRNNEIDDIKCEMAHIKEELDITRKFIINHGLIKELNNFAKTIIK